MRATNACVERLLLAVCELLALAGVGVQPAVEGVRAGLAVERVVDVTYDETITVAPTNAGGVTLNCTSPSSSTALQADRTSSSTSP
jgi:hypothetical protein